MDYTVLRDEIANDPLGVGYAGPVGSGSDRGVADLLNAATGPGAATVARGTVPLGDPAVASMLAHALLAIRNIADQSIRDYYTILIATISASGVIHTGDANVQAVVAQAIADGVVTQPLAAAVSSRTGSRAEVLFGAGVSVTGDDISKALRG